MPCLRIQLPENKGELTQVLAGQRITVGRRPDNTIQIIDRSVSGHHAELICENGHYRLHDLGSTNLTCVDGQQVMDFHLHKNCQILFGSIECAFSLEAPCELDGKIAEVVPTRAELEFLRRENLDLQGKIASQQKQIDILSSAPLMTKQTTQLGIAPDTHRKILAERDELRNEVENLKREIESFKADLKSANRDREAMRQAWETVKGELMAARSEIPDSRATSKVA